MRSAALVAAGLLLTLGAATPARAGEPAPPPERPEPMRTVWLPERPAAREVTRRLQQRAERAYAEARRAYQRGRYDAALQHADAAFRTIPNSSTALIRATILAALALDADAFDAYLLALDLDPTPEEAELASAGLARHGATLGRGWVALTPTPKGAAVELAGASWHGRRAVGLAPGHYVAHVRADGKAPARVELVIEAGQGVVREVKLAAPAPGPVVAGSGAELPGGAPAALVAEGEEAGASPAGLILTIGGGVLMAVGAGTHLAAASAASDADRAARASGATDAARRARYDDAVERKDSLETASWVLYGVGAALVATGIVVLVTADEAPGAEVVPVVGPDGAGARLRLGF